MDVARHIYRVLKGVWFKGGGYKGPLGNLKGTLGSTREISGLAGYPPLLGAPSHKDVEDRNPAFPIRNIP